MLVGKDCGSSEDGLRDSAVLKVVGHHEASVAEEGCDFVLDEAWDHTGGVHTCQDGQLVSAIVRLEGRHGHDVISNHIIADFVRNRLNDRLVALARVKQDFSAVLPLELVEHSDNCPV